uniref:Astacin domain-containing protein n=1 Tax=Strongyloides papillosus TaxID=174720 RepID=A0A0N5BQ83_STREA
MKTQKKSSVKTIKKTSVTRKPIPPKPNAMKTSSAKPTTRRVTTTTSTTKKTTKKEIKQPTPLKTTTRTTMKSTTKSNVKRTDITQVIPPYLIDSSIHIYVPKNYHQKITKIFGGISAKTGIKCLVSYRSPIKNRIGINFYEISKGYNKLIISHNKNVPTEVHLRKSEYQNMARLLFYIGLSLALIPEVSRLDSFRYVKINYDNIKDNYKKYYIRDQRQFIYAFTDFNFGSAMLSDQLFGSIDGKSPTYTFIDYYNSYQKLYDVKKTFSHNDYKILRDLYRSNTCSNKKFWCENGGYPDELCNKCICPSYFQGTRCEEIKNNSGSCGTQRDFEATKELDFILYKNLNGECYYTIRTNHFKKIKVIVETLIMPNTKCSTDDSHLGMLYRYDKGVEPFTICRNTTSLEFSATSSEVYIHFKITKGPNLLVVSFQEVD